MESAYIALGSNLNQPAKQLQIALGILQRTEGVEIKSVSGFYLTSPVGYLEQPDFINAVAKIETLYDPFQLLHMLLAIESEMGRKRSFPNASRVIDLDLLCYEGRTIDSDKLILPHPRMHERAFVLIPLNDIASELSIAGHGKVADMLQKVDKQGVSAVFPDNG